MSMISARTTLSLAVRAATVLLVAAATLSCGSRQTRSPSPTALEQLSGTEPATQDSIDPTAIPTQTQPAHVPPPPDSVTPRPTDLPVTEKPRVSLPTVADFKTDGNGKYYAAVDGCRWDEYGRFRDQLTGEEQIGLQTPCLPDRALLYSPKTGEIQSLIR